MVYGSSVFGVSRRQRKKADVCWNLKIVNDCNVTRMQQRTFGQLQSFRSSKSMETGWPQTHHIADVDGSILYSAGHKPWKSFEANAPSGLLDGRFSTPTIPKKI